MYFWFIYMLLIYIIVNFLAIYRICQRLLFNKFPHYVRMVVIVANKNFIFVFNSNFIYLSHL